jgi:hypothetical protein
MSALKESIVNMVKGCLTMAHWMRSWLSSISKRRSMLG